ncbi:hypothetical protein PPSIR1_30933 [Plesiocystis pacifica SIR-1]|uniref:Uncharacterized protein n=1 Tax=Plesiocystis pacifica SIR-1 TaxID=391625 RepID=A6GG65_9BACT|nr:DUF2914 domain-containing protein [Plesiocystis pacifica]EDM75134.1 hypothetical protein PPSIR1_30933 [Plesiocystis pacifica SIR-1]
MAESDKPEDPPVDPETGSKADSAADSSEGGEAEGGEAEAPEPEAKAGSSVGEGWGDLFGEPAPAPAPGAGAAKGSLFAPPALGGLNESKGPTKIFIPPIGSPSPRSSSDSSSIAGAFSTAPPKVPSVAPPVAAPAPAESKDDAAPAPAKSDSDEKSDGDEKSKDDERPERDEESGDEKSDGDEESGDEKSDGDEEPGDEKSDGDEESGDEKSDGDEESGDEKSDGDEESKDDEKSVSGEESKDDEKSGSGEESKDDEKPSKDDEKPKDDEKVVAFERPSKSRETPEPAKQTPAANDGGTSPAILYILGGVGLILAFVVFIASGKNKEAAHNDTKEPPRTNTAKDERPSAGPSAEEALEGPKPRAPDALSAHGNRAEVIVPETGGSEEGSDEVGESTDSESGGGEESGETGEPAAETEAAPEPAPIDPIPTPAKVDDPRDPSVIPPGTPAANAKAFKKLPVSIHDGPPIGAIGATGIHIDLAQIGTAYEGGKCTGTGQSFPIEGTDIINVCFRVVHNRMEETVRIFWEKDGVVTRRGKVTIRDIHAYKTRAYLKLRPEYVGDWQVRIVPEGDEDAELAVVKFRITE